MGKNDRLPIDDKESNHMVKNILSELVNLDRHVKGMICALKKLGDVGSELHEEVEKKQGDKSGS